MFARCFSFVLAPGNAAMLRLGLLVKLALLVAPLIVLNGLLMVRMGPQHGSLEWIVMGCCVSIWAYLALCIYSSVRRSVHALGKVLDYMANGDLTHVHEIRGTDEFSRMGHTAEVVMHQFSHLVSSIRSEAQLVAMAGDRLLTGATDLATRTQEQAQSLEQTSGKVAELVRVVQVSSSDAQQANDLTENARHAAEDGSAKARSAVASIRGLEERSGQMTDIISAIDEIAFQTNILAINAAVEAARAGESGRGFAVVAAEVRLLAQRCAKAAGQVKTLIESSVAEVRGSATEISEVSNVLSRAVANLDDVAGKARVMASKSSSQLDDLLNIEGALRGLDRITHSNSCMVESTAQSAERLRQQANQLSAAVITVKLRQGCADEARALVERAVDLM